MIKWKRVEAGAYISIDRRFQIHASWDRIYKDHWKLYDTQDKENPYRPVAHLKTLQKCKNMAEAILKNEQEHRQKQSWNGLI